MFFDDIYNVVRNKVSVCLLMFDKASTRYVVLFNKSVISQNKEFRKITA